MKFCLGLYLIEELNLRRIFFDFIIILFGIKGDLR